jgi:hypothetical protein
LAKFLAGTGAGAVTGDSLSPEVMLPVLASWFCAIAIFLPQRSALLLSSLAAAIRRKLFLFPEVEFERSRLCVFKKIKGNSDLQSACD